MEPGQNLANENQQTGIVPQAANAQSVKPLSIQQQSWIDYNALSGLMTDMLNDNDIDSETGASKTLRKMPITEFADLIGVSRETLRTWRNSIPNFWQLVNDRRQELAPQSRLQRVHETWYLKAAQLNNWPVTEAWLRNFDPNYKEARTKVEHDATGSLLDVLEKARTRATVIEGEVVDAADQNPNA